ncbi:MAG TPA: type III-A CRISPR-associated RAMP protein Csm5 [Lachnospiraceae bacterium]|nr:type III-A CRISPR-associated RAMP protein Csm5 [Lachnospiraceae bacterium]
MKPFLQEYHVKLKTVGPVFIGNGKEINKKEYIMSNRRVTVFNIQKLYQRMKQLHLDGDFEKFLLGESRSFELARWLEEKRLDAGKLSDCRRYILECNEFTRDGKGNLQILEFMKDAYMHPYVPGTSLKGMFRTIILGSDMIRNRRKYDMNRRTIIANSKFGGGRGYLSKEAGQAEQTAFHTLKRNEKRIDDAVNDWMSGFIVSDSEPLDLNNLTLCQKVERHADGSEKVLNILRECIAPGTEINFTITIDTEICPYEAEEILDAVGCFADSCYNNFINCFNGMDRPSDDTVWLGGGAGFVTKTIVYPLMGKEDGLPLVKQIFDKTLSEKARREHKHYNDDIIGASPHIIKCTRYNGQTLQMGMCHIRIV